MQVTIQGREPVHQPNEDGTPGAYLHLFVRATVSDGSNVRSGPFYVDLPADATDEAVQAAIAAKFAG